MESSHSQMVSLIWNIADDVLRDVFLRGQYRDVILPMVVLRRLDAPLKPTMVNAGPTDEPEKDPLDEIIKEFNEHWFRGWEATPDDQKEKLVNITKAVAGDADYQNLVIGNPDQQAVEAAMAMIIDRIIRQKRKGDMSLYREYQQNDAFKAGFRTLITRMLDNLEYL